MRWWRWVAAAAVTLAAPGCSLFRSQPPPPPVEGGVQVGVASWYGPGFHGRATASGEIFDQERLTAAHPSLPLGTRVLVTSLENGRAVAVRINDRGPFVGGRIVDLSYAAARELHMIGPGIMRVRLEVLDGPVATPTVVRTSAPPPAAVTVAATPPARPRAAPAPVPVPPPTYVVQLGAFARRDAAERLQREVARRFPEAAVTEPDGSEPYRVRLGPYEARRSAEARAQIVGRLGSPVTVVEAPSRP